MIPVANQESPERQVWPTDAKRAAWGMIHKLVRVIAEIPEEERGPLDDVMLSLDKFTGNSRGGTWNKF